MVVHPSAQAAGLRMRSLLNQYKKAGPPLAHTDHDLTPAALDIVFNAHHDKRMAVILLKV